MLCYITPELTLPFHTPLSTKSSQLFNKWDKAIPVRTRAATSALSSSPCALPISHITSCPLGFPTDFHLCNLSAAACSACWSIPLRSQHSLCHGAALESDSVDVHHPQLLQLQDHLKHKQGEATSGPTRRKLLCARWTLRSDMKSDRRTRAGAYGSWLPRPVPGRLCPVSQHSDQAQASRLPLHVWLLDMRVNHEGKM